MNFMQRKLEYWLADRFQRSSDESLRAFGFHRKTWIGKLWQRTERADPAVEEKPVPGSRRDGEDH